MNEQSITNLVAFTGRVALQKYWLDLTIEQRNPVLPSLFHIWRIVVRGSEFTISSSGETFRIGHPLGIRLGTRVFMEEIIVRHYFNNVQALVYLGAVLLLIFLALRFAGLLSENIALIGIGIEALMLLLLFIVLFYAPDDDLNLDIDQPIDVAHQTTTATTSEDISIIREVLDELEDIGGTYATLGARLEEIARGEQKSLQELKDRVEQIQGLEQLKQHSEKLERTNELLNRLVSSIGTMNDRIELLIGKELEYHVRKEIERHIATSASDGISLADRKSQQSVEEQ
ncbi:MAG: hypothetical protein J4G05_10260 [Chlorobi bacterium]|nr:hypothetical protein [Chlorobiota bacterium]